MPALLPALWEIDNKVAIARAAACALNLDNPFDPNAAPTHFIFVEPEDLQRELDHLDPGRKISLIRGVEGGAQDLYAPTAQEVFEWMTGLMSQPAYVNWKSPKFRQAAQDKFGSRADGVVFKRAWRRAVRVYPHFSKRGAPRLT